MSLFIKGYPTIRTERLLLRALTLSDLENLYELYNSEFTQKYQAIHYYSKEKLAQYILSQTSAFRNEEKIMWAIQRKSDGAFIGVRILYYDGHNTCEIQGDTMQSYCGKGYTKEAYLGIMKFIKDAFGNQTVCIYSVIRNDNSNAIGLINALNFKLEEQIIDNNCTFLKYSKVI